MIIYDFCCELDHRFEGWFASSDECAHQLSAGRIRCPLCDTSAVARIPSAPYLKSASRDVPAASETISSTSGARPDTTRVRSKDAEADADRARLAAAVEGLRKWVASTEDVGKDFADVARRIHQQEAPERAIRGVTTREEARALQDEGIAVLSLPGHLVDKLH